MTDKNIRLIDANEIANGINQYFCNVCSSLDGERCRDCEINEVLRLIDNTPTVEAEPVKHGRWITHDRYQYKCSECETIFRSESQHIKRRGKFVWDIEEPRFCSYCGTRLRGDKNDRH